MDKEGEALCCSNRAKCFIASGGSACGGGGGGAAERDSLMEGHCEEC